MPAAGRLSYEELAALVVRQAAQIELLKAEVADLRRQLGQDSRNSSKPPSSDSPFTKPAPRSLRGKSGRKPGGQPGHPGATLALVEHPNERKRHEPGPCSGCGASLVDAPEVGMERRQVFDLPCAMRRSVISPAQRGEIGGISLDLMANPAPKGNIGNSSMPGN